MSKVEKKTSTEVEHKEVRLSEGEVVTVKKEKRSKSVGYAIKAINTHIDS